MSGERTIVTKSVASSLAYSATSAEVRRVVVRESRVKPPTVAASLLGYRAANQSRRGFGEKSIANFQVRADVRSAAHEESAMAKRRVFPKSRDMTERQFWAEVEARGWRSGWGGYVYVTPEGESSQTMVYRFNAGERRRAQLVYLQREAARAAAVRALTKGETDG